LKAVIFTDQNDTFNLAKDLQLLGEPLLKYQLNYLKSFEMIDTIIIIGKTFNDREFKEDQTKYIFIKNSDESINLNVIKKYLDDDPFFLFIGNIITNYPLNEIIREHRSRRADITFLYTESTDTTGYYIKFDKRKNMKDIKYNDRQARYLVNNIFYINPTVLTYLDKDNYLFFEMFLPSLIKKNMFIHALINKKYFEIIDVPEKLYSANYELLTKELFPIKGNKINRSYYGDKCEIDFSVVSEGSQYFGSNCTVLPNSNIKDNIMFDQVSIGENCTITNSIIMDNVKIGNNCEIKNSIIGSDVKIENSVRLQNNSIITKKSNIKQMSGILNV